MTTVEAVEDPLDRMAQIGDGMRALQSRLATMRAAWPTGEVFHGDDSTGALRVEMTSAGRVSSVSLDDDWASRIGVRSLARAVNEAIGAASATLGDTWVDTWTDADAPAVVPQPRPRAVTLEEYRAAFPPPTSREELRARADAVAAAREARAIRERGDVQSISAPGRESFTSPGGRFTVTRSDSQLTGLEALPNALATMTVETLGQEIVAVLAEIERRALGDAGGADAAGIVNALRVARGSR